MAIGYLSIQARTAHDALALEGVQIKVLDDKGNIVYGMTTDENGETQRVPLETLSRDFSQSRYFSDMPYISYGVLAQKRGSIPFTSQIFPFLTKRRPCCLSRSCRCARAGALLRGQTSSSAARPWQCRWRETRRGSRVRLTC